MDPDQEMFEQLEGALKNIVSILSDWKKKNSALHGLAEQKATQDGHIDGPQKDAAIYAHRQALKRAMVDHAKAQQAQAPQDPQAPQGAQMPPGMQDPNAIQGPPGVMMG